MIKQIYNWSYPSEYYDRSLNILETALNNVPMYRSWKNFDLGPGCPVDTRFGALPALTKKDIRENFPSGILPTNMNFEEALARGEIQTVETSGTTDDKITNFWNQKWWNASESSSWKLNSILAKIATGSHPEAILVNPRNVGIISDEADLPFEKRRLDRFLYLNEKTDPVAWTPAHMDRMISELNTFRPIVFEANPSYLATLCRYIAASGKDVFQPGAIVFTYEYPAGFQLRQVRNVFSGVHFISSYGTTETGYVFLQCEEGLFHQNYDYCRVDFQPFKPEHGGPRLGRILVTPLNNKWSYLLRFDTGDIVELAENKCVCGRNSGMLVSAIAGRKTNLTLTSSGRLVTLAALDAVMEHLRDFDMYRLRQTDLRNYNLYLVSKGDKGRLYREAVSLLKDLYGRKAVVKVIFEQDIAPENSGKYLISRADFPINIDEYFTKI